MNKKEEPDLWSSVAKAVQTMQIGGNKCGAFKEQQAGPKGRRDRDNIGSKARDR